MLTPEQYEVLPDEIVELYREYESSTLNEVSRHIADFDYFDGDVDEHSNDIFLYLLLLMAALKIKSKKALEKTLLKAAKTSLGVDDAIYLSMGKAVEPFTQNDSMMQVLKANILKTNNNLDNLTMTTANAAQSLFCQAVTNAQNRVQNGTPYTQAIKEAIETTSRDGIKVLYPSGERRSVESAVRTNVITGIHQTTGKLQEMRCDEMGTVLVETTAHWGARDKGEGFENHESWQGKPFGYKKEIKIGKVFYPDFKTSTGYGHKLGLKGINCKHDFNPYSHGAKRAYSNELLESYKKKVTYNGKEISPYEALQKQRKMERKVREWKTESKNIKASGFDSTYADKKVREWQSKLRGLVDQTGVRRDYAREQIAKNALKYDAAGGTIKASGGLDPTSRRASVHARRYYQSVRKMKTDCKTIAANTQFTEKAVNEIKEHMFVNKIRFKDGRMERFAPDFEQSQAWARLIQGNHTEVDLVLLRHEYVELTQMRIHNLYYEDAHAIANNHHNWWALVEESRKEG